MKFAVSNPPQFVLVWVLVGTVFALPILLALAFWAGGILMLVSSLFEQNLASFAGMAFLLVVSLSLAWAACRLQKMLLERGLGLILPTWTTWFMRSLLVNSLLLGLPFMAFAGVWFSLTLPSQDWQRLVTGSATMPSERFFVWQEERCFFSNQGELSENYQVDANYEVGVLHYLMSLKFFVWLTLPISFFFQVVNHTLQAQAFKEQLRRIEFWILIPAIAALPMALTWIAFGTVGIPDIAACEPNLSRFLQMLQGLGLGHPLAIVLTFLLIPLSEALVLLYLQRRDLTPLALTDN